MQDYFAEFIKEVTITEDISGDKDNSLSGYLPVAKDLASLEPVPSAMIELHSAGKVATREGILRVVRDTAASIIGDASLRGIYFLLPSYHVQNPTAPHPHPGGIILHKHIGELEYLKSNSTFLQARHKSVPSGLLHYLNEHPRSFPRK